jgi:hypothetical protein
MKYDPDYILFIIGIKLFNIQKIYLSCTEYFLKLIVMLMNFYSLNQRKTLI